MRDLQPYFRYNDFRGPFIGITQNQNWMEVNYIETKKNQIRGKHYHKNTLELFFIISGTVKVNIFNVRGGEKREFIAKKGDIFLIEPFEVHTFKTLTDAAWINMLSSPLDRDSPDMYPFQNWKSGEKTSPDAVTYLPKPYLDKSFRLLNMIPIAEPILGQEELNNVIEAVKSGWISSKGKFIHEFEEGFANYCGAKHGVAVSNGTAALHLALTALGIKEGDEVIVPALTFIATANAARYTGAKPVFVDSHPDYWCIDPEKIERAIGPNTKAIVPVHLYGHPCDMDVIMDIAETHDLFVIEDAAEAHGAEYKGRKVGSFGDISCFSFYGNKIITTGEGGMCLTNDEELAAMIRILRDHGNAPNKRYWYDTIGYNYRMTNMQGAIGLAQIEKLDESIGKKRQLATWYSEELKDLKERGVITLHPEMPWAKCVYWLYSILIEDSFGMNRDELAEKLAENGIETRPFFYPIHIMPPYKNGQRFLMSERLSVKGLNLPSAVTLAKEDIESIVKEMGVH